MADREDRRRDRQPPRAIADSARQADAGRDRRGGQGGDRPQGHSGDDDFGHRRRSRQVHRVVLQLLRLQGSDGPRVGRAIPRRGTGTFACGRRTRPDQLGALLPGRRRPLEHLSQPAGRDHQRVAAGHDQRRLRRVLGRYLFVADRIDHADGETGSAARLLRPDDDPHLVAVAMVSMLNQFCYTQLSGDAADPSGGEEPSTTTRASPRWPTSSTARSTTRRPG